VGEGLGRDPTARRALDPIITNGSGGIEGVGSLGATDLALIVGRVAPDSGEAVRLQFETDGQRPTLAGMGPVAWPARAARCPPFSRDRGQAPWFANPFCLQ